MSSRQSVPAAVIKLHSERRNLRVSSKNSSIVKLLGAKSFSREILGTPNVFSAPACSCWLRLFSSRLACTAIVSIKFDAHQLCKSGWDVHDVCWSSTHEEDKVPFPFYRLSTRVRSWSRASLHLCLSIQSIFLTSDNTILCTHSLNTSCLYIVLCKDCSSMLDVMANRKLVVLVHVMVNVLS